MRLHLLLLSFALLVSACSERLMTPRVYPVRKALTKINLHADNWPGRWMLQAEQPQMTAPNESAIKAVDADTGCELYLSFWPVEAPESYPPPEVSMFGQKNSPPCPNYCPHRLYATDEVGETFRRESERGTDTLMVRGQLMRHSPNHEGQAVLMVSQILECPEGLDKDKVRELSASILDSVTSCSSH